VIYSKGEGTVLEPVKRIEILAGVQEFPLIKQVLKENGITGYMLLENVQGKGDRLLGAVDPLTGEYSNLLIRTTCPADKIDGFVESIRPILARYGVICVVYDAALVV
jgi:hypothetical protein